MHRTHILSLLATAGLAAGVHADVTFSVIASSGDDAPGIADATFDFFDLARLDGAGHVLFAADVEGEGIDELSNGTIYSDRSGALALLAREGDQAPFDNLVLYTSLTSPAFNSAGLYAFGGALDIKGGPEETTVGLFQEDDLDFLIPFAVDTFTAPGDIVLSGLAPAPFNDAGQSAFVATDGAGLWITGGENGLELVAQSGTSLVGMPDGTEVKHLSTPALAADGMVAFHASFDLPANDGPDLLDGLWIGDADGLAPLAIQGDDAPGYGDGVTFNEPARSASIEDGGSAAFFATVDGPGIDSSNDGAVWTGDFGGVSTAAREGDDAPGLQPGQVFSGLPSQIAINAGGSIAFAGHVTGGDTTTEDNSGIWSGAPGDLDLLVREGDAVPGAEGYAFGSFGAPALTDSGYVAFTAHLRQAERTFEPNIGLFLITPDGTVTLITRTGEAFAPNGMMITDLSFDSRKDGRSSLGEDGTVLFKLYFEDRSQSLVMGAQGCFGDFNGDGELNVLDFVAFQLAWQDQDPAADCDGNGEFSVLDFICFQLAWQAGCD